MSKTERPYPEVDLAGALALQLQNKTGEANRLKAQLDEAVALLRDVVDGEEDEYPVKAIRAFLAEVDNG